LLNKILKKIDFDGVVITDWGGTHEASRSTWFRYRNGNRHRRFNNSQKMLTTALFLANPFLKLLKSGEIEKMF
jgi:beta-glucosidase-like glycosyl hydrolase